MEKIRAFIAIDISEKAREEAARIQGGLKDADADVKWVPVGNIHITFSFLGDITLRSVEDVKDAMERTALSIAGFELSLDGLGAFPGWGRPRVIWIGIGKGVPEIERLSLSLDRNLEKKGFSRDSAEFKPHITIGRVRSGSGVGLLREKALGMIPRPEVSRIDRITLYRSELRQEGPVYTPIYEKSLAKKQ
ncbi:MAG: RNA 2',3'-cyclic phosphodiesterase [Candidatus Omnitrophica bacterium]|nr:RNA 2',3'-cyclic phosphodiesterase [Candidatus Omnitrophota bacterium]MDD5487479.1 RNA 2',3'-cyclic phosphodiesterase [Candidatus Omnitrophota bacterium]